jgi:hypothetical protein
MNPKVISVKEGRALAANGQPQKVIILTYTVGTLGPFTLTTNEADISSGKAQQAMVAFARTIGNLPGVNAS